MSHCRGFLSYYDIFFFLCSIASVRDIFGDLRVVLLSWSDAE